MPARIRRGGFETRPYPLKYLVALLALLLGIGALSTLWLALDTSGGWYGYAPLSQPPGVSYLALVAQFVSQALSIAVGVAVGVSVALWWRDRS